MARLRAEEGQHGGTAGAADLGAPYFDTDLTATTGKPIWWNGAVWVDAAGTAV